MKTTKALLVASLLCGLAGTAKADDTVVTATYGNATGNTTRTMTVALNHEKNYVAFHLVLTLPEGTTVGDDVATAKSPLVNGGTVNLSNAGGAANESTNFIVKTHQVGNKLNVVGYNYGNAAITGASGEILLTLPLKTAEGVAYDAAAVTAESCTFVDAASTEYALGTPTSDARLWGDADQNKVVDGFDAAKVANVSLKRADASTIDVFACDLNSDDAIDGFDAAKVANIVLKR